jgi:hypothetical protein
MWKLRKVMGIQVFSGVFAVATMLVILLPQTLSPVEATCGAPTIEAVPQTDGQLQIKIQSPCRKDELIVGRYGEFVIIERFDGNGNLAFHVDCFLGDQEIELTFESAGRPTTLSCASVQKALTKVAIVWDDHVDLDLHAFEYAAPFGSDYDRSARNPGSYEGARSDYSRSHRSHGFMSTISDGEHLGHNVEVYTLLHHNAEPRGLIAMGIGLGAHNNFAGREYCRNDVGQQLRVDLNVYVLEYGELRTYEREFAARPCGDTPEPLITSLVPNIFLGNGR